MSNELIFYGAGEFARLYLENQIEIWEPSPRQSLEQGVCFSDSDKEKQGLYFLGLPVLSIEEALRRYENAKIYLTVGKEETKFELTNNLLKLGVPIERIVNAMTYRITCPYLESFLVFGYHEAAFNGKAGIDTGKHSLKSCCSDFGKNQVSCTSIGDDLKKSFEEFLVMRADIITKLNQGIDNCCTGCIELKKMYTPVKPFFTYVIDNELGRCNCKCSYCNFEIRQGRDVQEDVDITEIMNLVSTYGFDNVHGWIELANGEITIDPNKIATYKKLVDKNIMFISNAVLYDEEIKRKMEKGNGKLLVSLDCGTRETYKQIKAIDGFDSVLKNLYKYTENNAGELILKYIFLPGINDNIHEVDEFILLCNELKVSCVHISYNLCLDFVVYQSEDMQNIIKYMSKRLEEEQIKTLFYF